MEFKEVLFYAQQGKKCAMEQIIEIYRPMLVRYSLVNGKFNEDLHQELLIEILKCIKSFKE